MVWKRTKSVKEVDTLLLSPHLAHQWQMLTFQQFLAQVPHKRLAGLDRRRGHKLLVTSMRSSSTCQSVMLLACWRLAA